MAEFGSETNVGLQSHTQRSRSTFDMLPPLYWTRVC